VSDGFVLLLADNVRIKEELELLQHTVSAIVRGLQKVEKYRLDGPQRPVDHRLIESVRHVEGCLKYRCGGWRNIRAEKFVYGRGCGCLRRVVVAKGG
jgi:hypothetical protein